MIINHKFLSIPPYISTSWSNITSVHLEEAQGFFVVIAILKNDTKIEIPGLKKTTIDKIFQCHAKFLEDEEKAPSFSPTSQNGLFSFGLPLKLGLENMETLGATMQHNPDQKDAPDLPKDLLSKITSIVRSLGINDADQLPKPEAHCNCIHCQIARVLQLETGILEENLDEEVDDKDLVFKDWEIKQTSDNLYLVVNPLNTEEQYNVYLGEPLGCTCGKKNCDHIKAVLKS